jgi:hypothetical protein
LKLSLINIQRKNQRKKQSAASELCIRKQAPPFGILGIDSMNGNGCFKSTLKKFAFLFYRTNVDRLQPEQSFTEI